MFATSRLAPSGALSLSTRAMFYVRYADECLVTFLAPKKEVHTFQAVLRVFLQERLKLTLYDPKMTKLGQAKALFLGTWISVGRSQPSVELQIRRSRCEKHNILVAKHSKLLLARSACVSRINVFFLLARNKKKRWSQK